jgi:hypothetical protein
MIRFASIPQEILEGLADALERNVASVAAYLNQPPTFAAGVSYRSEGVPTLAEPADFYVALLADEDLDEENRDYWRARRVADEKGGR